MSKYPILELIVITLSYQLQQIHCRPALGSSINFIEDFYYWNSSDTRTYPSLKICSENKRYEIQPGAWCSKGIYFPDGFIPHCVCPFGLWAVKTRVCDMHTHFLLGDSRRNICYYIDFKIESILFLGDPNNVFASKAYVSPYQLNVFYEIPMDGSYTPKLDLDNALVIHMFPINNRSIETEDGNCFPMIQQNRANVPVHIWASSLRPTRYRVVDKCKNPLNFGFDDLVAPNMVFVSKFTNNFVDGE
ncbi:unnamed protein product [Orchesella dallaii]|uniref:Uncharacterized protein n=1 Tax=Orchesella dallaii TaxID=48710 RepID=A0ABP1QHB5_9HEXA